ncbi:hypothetical protein PFICI_02842 [Pestalotiopsis fici W106-1]|uniref:BD-FAE-like domain-containing protein n=1 Tax=Pestalotiopsis fici (strain W106-1 / CGMCC3.15140) TaxID=1229662 RepID=W3XHB7_PESFW|nr:uncharacterized protein PFICI_02842 [Pestalotiopsis fici W106-1]ETS84817.1 hypothetical protein PFICI_02842 [Pestalotiopsis fici W106-1]
MAEKFKDFRILSTTYKTVGEHPLQVNVLIPRALTEGDCPVILRFHGGGFVTGDSLHPDWFPTFQVELALKHNAIVVTPNYRLLPESNGADIMQDMDDFWTWVTRELVTFVQGQCPKVRPNLDQLMTAGESAGGYLSIQVAMDHPKEIKACTAEFPSLQLESSNFTEPSADIKFPLAIVESHVASMTGGQVVSSDPSISRFPLIMSMTDNGVFLDYFGRDERLLPFQRVEKGGEIPPLFIIHGDDDEIVPVEGSKAFVSLLQDKRPGCAVKLSTAPGGHGLCETWHMDHPALEGGLNFAITSWLS